MSKYFTIDEFRCKDKKRTPVPPEYRENCELLMKNLDVLREALGVPVTILSGYRTPEWNKHVGGKPKSYHMVAMAADIVTKEYTPKQVHAKIEKLIKAGKMKNGGLGLYKGFVHVDVRNKPARW